MLIFVPIMFPYCCTTESRWCNLAYIEAGNLAYIEEVQGIGLLRGEGASSWPRAPQTLGPALYASTIPLLGCLPRVLGNKI